MKYHISPKTGRPNQCKAVHRCPIGGEHFDTPEQAREAYEKQNEAVPEGHTKYDRYDRPLRGTGTGPGGRDATLARSTAMPSLTYEAVETNYGWGTQIIANGSPAFVVESEDELELVELARSEGQWVKVKSLMEEDSSSVSEMVDLLTYAPEELEEKIAIDEEERPRKETYLSERELRKYDRNIELQKLALSLRSSWLKEFDPEAVGQKIEVKKINVLGEKPYDEITDASGKKLGTVTYNSGFFLASVHNGRAPVSVGQFDSHQAAIDALVRNNGINQA